VVGQEVQPRLLWRKEAQCQPWHNEPSRPFRGAAFTRLANLTTAQGSFLYAADFAGGRINAFDPRDGGFRGTLRDEQGRAIVNDRLWALRFGNGVFGGPTDLVFSAGIQNETHGLLGTIQAVGD